MVNKSPKIISFVYSYLEKMYQEPQLSLEKFSDFEEMPEINIEIDKIKVREDSPGNYCFRSFSVNGFLKSFFNYLLGDLSTLLDLMPHQNVFFAGLFDADGNILLEDGCFRWACRDVKEVETYKRYLKEIGLFHRYDGSNLVTYNKDRFKELIYPYLKHTSKINKANLILHGEGRLNKRFKDILKIIVGNPGKNASELADHSNKERLYSQIKFLERQGYVRTRGYPRKIFITEEGRNELNNRK